MSSILPHIETPDYAAISNTFAQELQSASVGRPSSLSFIKHQLPEKPLLTQGIAQGIVIGGTNYFISTEEIHEGVSRKILDHHTGILPTFTTKQVLYDFFKKYMDPRAEAIGINFGFPLKPMLSSSGKLDGILINSSKEHTFTGLEGLVGQLAANIFETQYHKRIPVSIANDTVCLALATNTKIDGSLIVGTGFNIALRQTINNTDVIVNLETGNFNKFELFDTLKQIDVHSEKPSEMLFEKSISGKYLHEHFNLLIEEFGLSTPPLRTGLELTALASGSTDEHVKELSRQIITRSARLVASATAGVYHFLGQPKSMTLIGDGSLLWNGWQYQSTIKKQLETFGIAENVITIQHIPDSSSKGAIGLVTSM